MNFLEQLVSEWYSFRGFFVRTNVFVGKRSKGGYEGELDVVAFRPETKEVVHIETSMDADSWGERRTRFATKFARGREHIPKLFSLAKNTELTRQAVFGYPRSTRDQELLGKKIRVYLMPELVEEISRKLASRKVESKAVPETYPLLRAMQRFRRPLGWLQGQGRPIAVGVGTAHTEERVGEGHNRKRTW